jgi:hypothetical protein
MEYFRSLSTTVVKELKDERAKVMAALKPGKDGSDPAHYRSISLLSVVYKLLECLILRRIQPETATPVHQVGFRQQQTAMKRLQHRYRS